MSGDAQEQKQTLKEVDPPQAYGPITSRGCTDVICCGIFIAHWVFFVMLALFGMKDGAPSKLYRPRDFRGDYCGLEVNWNNGSNLLDHSMLVQLMNVSSAVDNIAKQLVCSSAAEEALVNILDPLDLETYLCSCCKSPCNQCAGVLGLDDVALSQVQSTIGGKMIDLTDKNRAVSLFSPAGPNTGSFASIWSDLNKWFLSVCVKSCADATSETTRPYQFSPTPDMMWKKAWDTLRTNAAVPAEIRNTITSDFNFLALPAELCPYDPKHCIPWPGVGFDEIFAGFCTFKMPGAVLGAVGATKDSLNIDTNTEMAYQGLGDAFGDIIDAYDCLIIVFILSFAMGFAFLVLLRFLIKIVVWTSLCLVFFCLAAGGCAAWVRAGQCMGSAFLDTGESYLNAASSVTTNAITGTTINTTQEEFNTVNGADYRGMQTKTRTGRLCQAWASQTPHAHASLTVYPDAGLDSNYCRNPMNSQHIWCYTTDPETRWEMCNALGIQPWHQDCPTGYVVPDETSRHWMKVFAVICWVLSFIWLLLIVCLYSKIALAIALNQVAGDFIKDTPRIVLVPIVQAGIGCIYVIFWMICASYILSKVPDDYVSFDAFATYREAFGTEEMPGTCTNKWPAGYVWRYEGNISSANDTCSGVYGDTTGITPRCWRCMPPRYIFGTPFTWALFSLLWNNAFLIAVGQAVIAGSVGLWFFTPHGSKTKVRSVTTAFRNALFFHLGSLAFGAFILAVVQTIRYIIMYYERQMNAMKNKGYKVIACMLKVTVYLIWCLEKCLKFLTKNAYIQIAIKGTNFCVSAKNAFKMIYGNTVRFAMLAGLGGIINVIGTLAIVISTGFLGYLILQALHPEASCVAPMCVFIIIAYVIAKLFMTVFHLTVDTMLQCFIEVEGNPEIRANKEQFVPKTLSEHIRGSTE